jgi:hypothetical protein
LLVCLFFVWFFFWLELFGNKLINTDYPIVESCFP